MDIKKLSNYELKHEILSLTDLIYGEMSCYGKRDLILLDALTNEADERGIEMHRTIRFTDPEDED